jgi:hypothetical protein
MIHGVTKRYLHCILKPYLERKFHVSFPFKKIRPPAPSSLPVKNNNCLLLIVTIPGWRWIACRKEARGTSRCRRCWASLKTSALRLRRASVRPRSSPWLTSTAYMVLARPCAACAATATSAGICR